MKKFFTLLVIILLLLFFVQSCQKVGESGMKNNEIEILIEKLLIKGIKLHNLLRFDGVEISEDSKINMYNTEFCEVIGGYSSTSEIKKDLNSIFTKEVIEKNFIEYFNINNGIGPKFIDFENKLYINMGYGDYGGRIVWLTEKMKIANQNGKIIKLKIPVYYIAYEGSENEIETREISLKKEDGIWKLDDIVR
jgi:hypothetical protein